MSLESRSKQRWNLIDDPRTIRALAHPLRLELRSIVGRSGKLTAADAARELGISHGLASHHLRQLAKYGFVEQVEGADNRERPWRLVTTSHSVEGLEDNPDGAAAVAVLEQVTAERALEDLAHWHERRADWAPGWRKHGGVATSTVYLTQKELTGLERDMEKLLLEYVDQRPLDDIESRPAGSVPVEFTLIVVPREATAAGH
ncbi:MAG TPA: helix-turn-helix domain-containing protein [Thermoleophilaceae bacterium]|jgi:DNA-binding transcriptional ArsR family regulator